MAGYCCLASESLEECARNAGFSIPPSLVAADKLQGPQLDTPLTASIGVATAGATLVLGTPAAHTGHASAATAKPAAAATSTALPKAQAGKNGTSPYVQVSVARKEQWTLVYMTLGMGVVGLIMATF